MVDDFGGMTAREARLHRIQAGLPPEEHPRHVPSSSQAQRMVAIRQGTPPAQRGAPPKGMEISDKAAELIALALKDLLRS